VSGTDQLSSKPPPALPGTTLLLTRLRAGTRTAHDRIEAAPELCCLLSPSLTAERYVHALRALHAFHARMCATLPELLCDFLDLFSASGGHFAVSNAGLRALTDDLAWFGAAPAQRMAAVDSLNDAAAALGALYVVEGSALGARVIGRAVSVSLGVEPGQGGSFFCGATAAAARQRWQDFSTALAWAEPILGEAGIARVVGTAVDVFHHLEHALTRPPAIKKVA